jgi:capsular exopolysaccharide synthesis family protein
MDPLRRGPPPKSLFGGQRLAEVATKLRGLVDPGEPSAEPFRTLRLAIELRPEVRTRRALVFTSPQPRDGKTTIAANFALVCALTHTRVLLVDADLRSPRVHEVFGVPRSPGLVEVLRDQRNIETVVHRVPTLGHLDVLTAGAPLTRPGDFLTSPHMSALLGSASREYDLVVADSSPVLVAADTAGLASQPGVDVLLVIRRNGKRRALHKALKKLELPEANVLGLVINRDGRPVTYGY